jgi:hypothetical protein
MQGDGRRVRAAKTGAKIGAACGLAIGQAVMASNSPLGFYTGSVLLLLGSWTLAGAAAGAGIGWLAADEPGSS